MKIKFLVIFAFVTVVICQNEEETEEEKMDRINTQWEFILYDLIDAYDEQSMIQQDVFLHKSSYKDKVSAELTYSKYLRGLSKQMVEYEEQEEDIPSDYQRMYDILRKPNNAVLADEDLTKLIEFSNEMEEMSANNFIEDPDNSSVLLDKRTYEDKLMMSRNISYLETIWNDWQGNITHGNYNFTEILFLAEKAASLNSYYDIVNYWEEMVQYPSGYEAAKNIWEEIEPFYRKLHQFVLDRINNYYKTNFTNIPVYLSGSRFGEDWSGLASIVLPHQQIYHDAITSLNEKTKKGIYHHCSKVADALKFKQSSDNFWKISKFNMNSCPAKILSFCSSEYSILLTCDEISWTQYLDMQEKALEVGTRNLHYNSLPYRHLRNSFIEEAIQSLGSGIAVHNLANDEFVEKDAFGDHLNATENVLSAKLLLALRVLPKLAYYYAVDNWRINELQYPSGDVVKSWWDSRVKYQGVEGITNEEEDFLEDEFIIRNKPYLGKFLGTVLQFSMLPETYSEDTNVVTHLIEHDFNSVVTDILRKDPKDIMSWHYDMDELLYYSIKGYFVPLEEYFTSAPLEPHPFEHRKPKKKPERKLNESTTSISTTEDTPEQNLARTIADVFNEMRTPKDIPKIHEVLENASGLSIGMYILITAGACVLILIALLAFKRIVKTRRPKTNNRRFQT